MATNSDLHIPTITSKVQRNNENFVPTQQPFVNAIRSGSMTTVVKDTRSQVRPSESR